MKEFDEFLDTVDIDALTAEVMDVCMDTNGDILQTCAAINIALLRRYHDWLSM